MKIRTVKLVFNGSTVANELYEIVIDDTKNAIKIIGNDVESLTNMKMELMEMLAIVNNRLMIAKGHKLANTEE